MVWVGVVVKVFCFEKSLGFLLQFKKTGFGNSNLFPKFLLNLIWILKVLGNLLKVVKLLIFTWFFGSGWNPFEIFCG